MTNSQRRATITMPVLCCPLLLFSFQVTAEVALQAESEVPTHIYDALEKNARALSSIAIVWERRQSSRLSLEELLEAIGYPHYEQNFFEPETIRYVWQDGRYHWHRTYMAASLNSKGEFEQLRRKIDEVSFDSMKLYMGNGADSRKWGWLPSVVIDTVGKWRKKVGDDEIIRPRYFYDAGYKFPTTANEHGSEQQSLVLYWIAQGAVVTMLENVRLMDRQCFLIEMVKGDRKYRFYLDRDRGYAVVRLEERTEIDVVAFESRCRDFSKLSGTNVWLPRRCEVDYYSWPTIRNTISDEPLVHVEISVSELRTESVPGETFVLKYTEPGTRVADGTLPGAARQPTGRLNYSMPARLEDLDAVVQHAIDGTPFTPRPLRRTPSRLRMLLVTFNGVLAGIVLVVLAWRSWHGRRTRP